MSELTHMNRIATAGELSASIAHEINQPLAVMASSAAAAKRWLAAKTPNLEEARAALTHVEQASHDASEIVLGIRAMFRKDVEERSLFDINQLILAVLTLVRPELQRYGVGLETRLDERIPIVEGNRVQLQQVVLNLIMNAIEAMHSVELRMLRVQSRLSKPGILHVSVEDSGMGIDSSNLDRVF
jgi:C4-dicarboxylate-specific signal transduction histidine kinase